jgi:hypothetical protein
MGIDARPHLCGDSLMILMFVPTLADSFILCLIYNPILRWCSEIGTSSIDWAQLSRFHLKTETESSLWNVFNKNRTMDNVQKYNNCINIPTSQTFRPSSNVCPGNLKSSSNQEISRLSRNPDVYRSAHKSPPPVPMLNPVNDLPTLLL